MLKYALIFLVSAIPASASDFTLNALKASDLRPAAENRTILPAPAADSADKASYIQMTSSIKVKMDKEKGEITIGFPKVEFGDAEAQDKSYLFVKLLRQEPAPVISWATVLCSGGHYLGYKGSTLSFPEQSGSFSISEMLALGTYPSQLISRTHPWLAGEAGDLSEMCSAPFLEKMKDARVETLPSKIGDYSFEYNRRKNALKVSWK